MHRGQLLSYLWNDLHELLRYTALIEILSFCRTRLFLWIGTQHKKLNHQRSLTIVYTRKKYLCVKLFILCIGIRKLEFIVLDKYWGELEITIWFAEVS